MGGGASSMQHRLHKLSADSVQQLVEGIGPSFVEIAKQMRENGLDGEYLESASDEDLKEIFDDLKVPKIKQKLLRQKLAKLKDVTPSTGSLDTRTDGSGRAMGSSTLSPMVRQIAADDVVLDSEPIGEGGFSIVFRGTWNQQGTFGCATRSRRIAAKRSRVAGLGAEVQNDMARELSVMADFPHQNVLIVHIAAFQNCVALDANHSDAWFELGWAYRQQNGGTCEASIEPYTRCIALDPKHVWAHNNLGSVLQFVRKDYDGAEKMYRKAMELDPKHAQAHWNLSIILDEQKNDIPGAIKLMEECIRLGGVPGRDNEQRLATLRDSYVQMYTVLKASKSEKVQSVGSTAHHDVLFRFGSWCYAGSVQLTPLLDLADLPHLIPALRMQQSRLDFICDVSQMPLSSPFAKPMGYFASIAPAMEKELVQAEGVLAKLLAQLDRFEVGGSVSSWLEGWDGA